MRLFFPLLIIVCLSANGQSKKAEPTKSPLIFKVNNKAVFADEFIYLYKKNHTKPEDFKEEKINEYVRLLINFKLKIEEAKSKGMDTTKAFIKEFAGYKEELKKPYQVGGDDLDRLTKQAYDRLKEEVKAAHILMAVANDAAPEDTLKAFQKITDIRKRVVAGEDFQKLAKELSDDPSAKTNGGDLGYFTTMQMVYPFETAAYNLNPNEISNPVRSRFGYHLIKVLDRKPARGEVEVSHILVRTAEGNDKKVKNKIFDIYDQFKAGRSWDELCNEFSEDGNTKSNGGRLRAFGVRALASVPEFENVAFAMKNAGDVSDPFQSTIGWHIIRLEKKIPLPTYKEVESSLKKKVAHDERTTLSKQELLEKKKNQFAYVENKESKKLILAFADSSLVKGKWHYAGEASILNKPAFTLSGKSIAIKSVVDYFTKHQTITSTTPMAFAEKLYNGLVEETITEVEEEKLYAENADYRMLLGEYKEGIILFEIMEKEVWNKASKDSTGQQNYYNQHKEKYKAGDRVEAQIFASLDKALIEELRKKMIAGDTIKKEELKKLKSVMSSKAYEKGESKVIDKINWVTGLHEVQIDNIFYLVDVKRLVPPGYKTFEEARASVISEYQDFLEKTWIESLKKKYKVELNNKGKKFVMDNLIKK